MATKRIDWSEDAYTPRVDHLAADFGAGDSVLSVAHPEWFRPGDVVRVGDEDRYDTGEVDEFGNPIYRVYNEAVKVLSSEMTVQRGVGIAGAQPKQAGEQVLILGSQR